MQLKQTKKRGQMFFKQNQKRKSAESIVSGLADVLLTQGLKPPFREEAKKAAATFSGNDLKIFRNLLKNLPEKSVIYDPKQHGLGGWISACQFAIFEIVYHIGEDALPLIREIAWGEYDWIQGNAIELLIRLASEGVQRNAIINEIKENYPQIRYEAQLYAIKPLINHLGSNQDLDQVFEQLMQLKEFKDAYDELTYVDPDPYNIFKEELRANVLSSSLEEEKSHHLKVVAILILDKLSYVYWHQEDGNVRVGINENCQLFELLEDEAINPTSIDTILSAKIVAIGHWSSVRTDTELPTIYPNAVTKIE